MPFEIRRTTANQVVDATEACVLRPAGASTAYVAEFLDTTEYLAEAALSMAVQLGFVRVAAGNYLAQPPLARHLVACDSAHRAAVLRFALEQYEPYRTFRDRLDRTNHDPRAAATQAKAIHSITSHRDDIAATLADFGVYCRSLESEGAGLYKPREGASSDHLLEMAEVVDDGVACELKVRERLGPEAADWADRTQVMDPFVTAYQKLRECTTDPRSPILHAGLGNESFLSQVATHHAHVFTAANGIIQRADSLHGANLLKTKHWGVYLFLGHVRNAADHGTDDREINSTWDINPDTAVAYVSLSLSATTAVVAELLGQRHVV
jgi:hypothetical protein